MGGLFRRIVRDLFGLNLYGLNLVVGAAWLGMAACGEHNDICKQSQ
jgi:hypothetical protein